MFSKAFIIGSLLAAVSAVKCRNGHQLHETTAAAALRDYNARGMYTNCHKIYCDGCNQKCDSKLSGQDIAYHCNQCGPPEGWDLCQSCHDGAQTVDGTNASGDPSPTSGSDPIPTLPITSPIPSDANADGPTSGSLQNASGASVHDSVSVQSQEARANACPQGHELGPSTGFDDFTCDLCEKAFPPEAMMGCRVCDWDACAACRGAVPEATREIVTKAASRSANGAEPTPSGNSATSGADSTQSENSATSGANPTQSGNSVTNGADPTPSASSATSGTRGADPTQSGNSATSVTANRPTSNVEPTPTNPTSGPSPSPTANIDSGVGSGAKSGVFAFSSTIAAALSLLAVL